MTHGLWVGGACKYRPYHQSAGSVWIRVFHGIGGLDVWDGRGGALISCAGDNTVMGHPQVDILVSRNMMIPQYIEKWIHCHSLCQAAVAWSLGPHLHMPAGPRCCPVAPSRVSSFCMTIRTGVSKEQGRNKSTRKVRPETFFTIEGRLQKATGGTAWPSGFSSSLHPFLPPSLPPYLCPVQNPAYKFSPHYQDVISELCPEDKRWLPAP